MFLAKCLVVKGVRNSMFIDQGFPHLQQEERPAGVKR